MIFKLASLLIISNTKNFSLLRLPKKEAKSEKQKNRKERIFRKNVLNTCNPFQTILAIIALKGDFYRVVFSRGPGGQVGNVGQMLTKVASQ